MSVKTAVIGLGIMGRRMVEHMAAHPGYSPVAIWDPDAEACRLAQALAPQAQIAETAETAIAAADLVYLACPPAPRKSYAMAAADAGKSVFLENRWALMFRKAGNLWPIWRRVGVLRR